jgi:predicted Zn-dependent protease
MRTLLLFSSLAMMTASAQDRNDQLALGKQIGDEIREQSRPIESLSAGLYANEVCRRLLEHLPTPQIPYSLELISGAGDWTTPKGRLEFTEEALVLPGGTIFIRADQVVAAQSEAEFVGILAHAMAHLVQGPFIRPDNGRFVLLPAMAQDRARREFDADLLAAQMASDAGYDPRGLLQYLKRLERHEPGTSSAVFAPPPRAERVAMLENIINRFPRTNYDAQDPAGFARIQADVRQNYSPQKPHAPSTPGRSLRK